MAKLRGTNIPERGKCSITGHASMRDVKECAKVCGSHWFEPGTMRFFKSRVGDTAYADGKGGAYFVSSEKHRHYSPGGSGRQCGINTIGEFQGYGTAAKAAAVAKRLAAKGGLSGRARARRRR